MSAPRAPEEFIKEWLDSKEQLVPDSQVVKAVTIATDVVQLDEAKLLKRLRELSKPMVKEKNP
jgi:hypothetical protein